MIGAITAGLYGTGVPPVTSSYESIATVDASAATSVSFTSIGSTYKHLQIRFSTKRSATDELAMRFNGATTNYSLHYIRGDGSSAVPDGTSMSISRTYAGIGGSTTDPLVGVIDILDYTNTNKIRVHRTLAGVDNNGSGQIGLYSGAWNSTAAITSIELFSGTGGVATLTGKFALYGIKG